MKKFILVIISLYLLVGIYFVLIMDDSARGGFAGAIEWVLLWPMAFIFQVH